MIQTKFDILKNFCAMVLCGHKEAVFRRCKDCIEKDSDEDDRIESILYVFSGSDVDENDPYRNVADEDKQLVKPQFYLISTDAGAPELEDFFGTLRILRQHEDYPFLLTEKKFQMITILLNGWQNFHSN